ncbi:UDP-N-acetylmuramoylalanine--D-glutamate ligase [Enterococcus florum]|uniref:UDP-N-acetylmuramoylalanine--D-glutamate ligase n=1 Tax=Enterococcus florum TaxID=2480627 RepID=A0A4P5PD77_9ENTE|nr:UDP-N-acetylmuramoyl-L-alanine--D-glutamate ligase [Enterococcus florum]GCF93968.1 UDP-N-acetylmuramoylalanine--D-glutamate ligase [Enterococcus florum]
MKEVKQYQNEKVLVLGLAKSGFSAAKLLHRLGALVTVNDGKPFDENPAAQDLLEDGIRVITGSHPIELLDEDFSLMVKNPGIPYSNPLVRKAEQLHIPILTEVELAYLVAECAMIGITGTNGKTTTTTMIGLLLNQERESGKAYLAGNIGYPASEVAQKVTNLDDMVIELSSFQLMGIEKFKPHIAVITNIYEAHLDYHGTRENYVAAKWAIQENMQSEDFLIINWDSKELQDLSKVSKASIVPFSAKQILENGAYQKENELYFRNERIMKSDELGVPGIHNIENALAAIAAAKLKGVSNSAIRTALSHFNGVAHRTQFVTAINDRKFYNDSKATNSLATEMALSGFENSQVILLAGGLDRGNDFDELIPSLEGLKAVILFGETKEKMADAAKQAGIETILMTENVETAVPMAYELSQPGDNILLSPANASWDQYSSFEIRGDKFMQAVESLEA